MDVLSKHRGGLDAVARALLDNETIDGAEVARLVDEAYGSPVHAEGAKSVPHFHEAAIAAPAANGANGSATAATATSRRRRLTLARARREHAATGRPRLAAAGRTGGGAGRSDAETWPPPPWPPPANPAAGTPGGTRRPLGPPRPG